VRHFADNFADVGSAEKPFLCVISAYCVTGRLPAIADPFADLNVN